MFLTGFTSLSASLLFSSIDHLRLYPLFLILFNLTQVKFSLSTHLLMFLIGWVGSGWNWCIYPPHRRYQVKPHSSPWFSAICAAAIVHFFCLDQQNKSSEFKVKFRQANNLCKKVVGATKLAIISSRVGTPPPPHPAKGFSYLGGGPSTSQKICSFPPPPTKIPPHSQSPLPLNNNFQAMT